MLSKEQFAKMQDHSVLEPYATLADIDQRLQETLDYGLGATYVEPCYVAHACQKLAGRAKVGTVIGFPFGTNTTPVKIAEGLGCIADGADKLDVVMNYFIKTSTGTGSGGCRIGDIRLMRKICGDKVKIKAAAQISSIEDALAVIAEGASAIGENTAVKLLADWDKQLWE